MGKFFNGEFPDLLEKLEAHFDRARSVFKPLLGRPVEALILGGGYGRGEGGVALVDGQANLFNDLDYFLFSNAPDDPALLAAVRQFEREESAALGIDVEVSCKAPSVLSGGERTMMYFDLGAGHHVVVGPEDYLAGLVGKLDPARIDAIEATRLLWNRGSGLFFARTKLDEPESASFIHRNHQKLALALGDALLCVAGKHSAFCEERGKRLGNFDDPLVTEDVRRLHAEGVAFKQRPSMPTDRSVKELTEQNAVLRQLWKDVFLATEGKRLNTVFADIHAYAGYKGKLFPAEPLPRCLLLALRDRLKRGDCLRPVTDYPRGALMRALALLNSDKPDWDAVSRFLPAREPGWSTVAKVYETWWAYYS